MKMWQPVAFFVATLGFYIYNGVQWNTWMKYLPHILAYALICGGLMWALHKKEQYKNNRKS